VLARWSGWGAIPKVFDESNDRYAEQRETLRRLLGSDQAWAQARRTTLNAHYTSAEVAAAMWSTLGDLGLTEGRVLEPGCGSGVFLGLAPEGAEVVGVELDATTARVADHLYGARAEIHEGGFEEFAEPDGSFDAVIGNVPFGKIAPYDPRHNRSGHTLHNYFLVKSLRLTRPGGLVVALSSRYTLDARNPAARREMARVADLVGAVRLPERTFAGAAGTDVVTDLLVLRRRQPGTSPEGPAWTGTVPLDLADVAPEARDAVAATGEPLVINEYLADRGDMVLGDIAVARGMYREHELTVTATGPVQARLIEALDRLTAEAKERGATLTGRPVAQSRSAGSLGVRREAFDTRHAQEGSLVVGAGGLVGQYKGGRVVAYRPQRNKDFSELRRLIGLRDAVRQVLAAQLAGGSDDEVATAQHTLSDSYADYRRIYGPLNRYRVIRTKRADPETGEPVMQRRFPSMGGFRKVDPDWPLVAALEMFDDDSQTAEPAPVFSERVVAPPAERARVESASDAVAVCLDESGMVTTERVAALLGVTEQRARAEMGELVFEDPETAGLVPASQYLAGNVRRKLKAARTAAAGGDQRWQANIAALERAMPRQLEPGEIAARLGAAWIPAADVEAFCNEVFQASVDIEHLADIGRWAVKLRFGDRRSVVLSSVWGTERASAVNLLDSALNQRLHTVYDTVEDGGKKRRVRNDEATLAARDKQEAIGNRFSEWVWEDPRRARRLADTYNELYRSVTLTEHDGSHLSLPGLAATFTPRPHQRDAVARILTDGRALLAHA
jgi:SAM-dependent methyltransferase